MNDFQPGSEAMRLAKEIYLADLPDGDSVECEFRRRYTLLTSVQFMASWGAKPDQAWLGQEIKQLEALGAAVEARRNRVGQRGFATGEAGTDAEIPANSVGAAYSQARQGQRQASLGEAALPTQWGGASPAEVEAAFDAESNPAQAWGAEL